MIATRFRSVVLAVSVATAALGCYMVSLRVASERNQLLAVERRIEGARGDIRGLTIEIATRGRMGQLEQWNSDVLGLAAPKPAQYLSSEVQLASLTRVGPAAPPHVIPVSAPIDAPTAPAAVVTASLRDAVPPRAHAAGVTTAEMLTPAVPDAPLLRRATFVKPAIAPTIERTALLDTAALDDIARVARSESSRKAAR